MHDVLALLARQAGVVSRAQLLEAGVTAAVIRRRLRRRDLVLAVPGVYVDHTGELTWEQRTWVAVLALAPAALCHRSALLADDGPAPGAGPEVVHVAVDRDRSPAPPPGVRLHRLVGLEAKVRWNASPPRVRVEHAVLDVAAGCEDELASIAVLADAVQSRRTTPTRLLGTLATRPRIARRAFLEAVLHDVEAGTCSVLEHAYVTRVERPHGLPASRLQAPDALATSGRAISRDVEYAAQHVFVELDGRMFHDTARGRDTDLERDLDAATDGRLTLRLGWGQVLGRGCATAAKVAGVLRQRGWDGAPTPCPTCRDT